MKTAMLHVTCHVAPTPAPYASSFPAREARTAPLLLPPCQLGNPGRGRQRQHVFSSVITGGVMLVLLGFGVSASTQGAGEGEAKVGGPLIV